MKRREALISLLGLAGTSGWSLPARGATLQSGAGLSERAVEEMLRTLAEVEPAQAEAAAVRSFLLSLRSNSRADPRLQPAVFFDPEAEAEG